MAKLEKLKAVSDSISVNRYDNGWMVEVTGRNVDGDWKTLKILCTSEEDLISLVSEYNKKELD
jgi:hypothetical protein